jgi:L-methionine (R)-S-oxide reductase
MSTATHSALLFDLENVAAHAASLDELMHTMVHRLAESVPTFHWVGFYMIDPVQPNMLQLGPFVGAPTEHVRIPLDKGICGAAAARGETIVVDDVQSDPRYLACSIETRSEIVVPVYAKRKVVGELDIDSHAPAAFGPAERELVERCAALVGQYIETRE